MNQHDPRREHPQSRRHQHSGPVRDSALTRTGGVGQRGPVRHDRGGPSSPRHDGPRRHQAVLLLATVSMLGGYLLIGASDDSRGTSPASPATVDAPDTTAPGDSVTEVAADIVDEDPTEGQSTPSSTLPAANEGCTIKMGSSLRSGSTGADVTCLQQALIKLGYLEGEPTGTYGPLTVNAVIKLQTDRALFVDGDAGRETAISLGIWPDEGEFVVRTPVPAAGAKDLTGYPLSSVASAGDGAPPLPENSGTGRRIVYDRKGQRVWAVDKDGRILRSWLVSGSMYSNETPGVHKVYSRSEYTTAWNGKATLKYMVRWLKTDIGAIGFHQIPVRRSDKKVYQTEEELGTRLSGGCQRQAKFDAEFLWKFATVGTKVVVL